MTDPEIRTQRINGELHQVTPVRDQDGTVVSHHVHRLHLELSIKDIVQIVVGATILAIGARSSERGLRLRNSSFPMDWGPRSTRY